MTSLPVRFLAGLAVCRASSNFFGGEVAGDLGSGASGDAFRGRHLWVATTGFMARVLCARLLREIRVLCSLGALFAAAATDPFEGYGKGFGELGSVEVA